MACVGGIDIGSAYSKAVIKAGDRLAYNTIPTGGNYELAAKQVTGSALSKLDLSLNDLAFVVATGYGAAKVPFASEVVTDISCEGRGVFHLFPSVRTVISIGRQFSKVLRLSNQGMVSGFVFGEKCAAGSGLFLQVIARVLQVELAEIGTLSLRSRKPVDFNTGCAVFAESEAVSRVAEGISKEDILAGVHRAMAAKIVNLVERAGREPDYALVGGGARDVGLVGAIEEQLKVRLLVPDEPQIVAALGAALIAESRTVTAPTVMEET